MAVVAAGGQGVQVIDLSNPVAPSVIGSYNTPGSARGVALNSAGTLAYVADFYSLQIISLSNPRAPSLVGSLSWSSGGWIDVAVSGGIACVADQLGNALFVVDVSIPNAPQRVGYKTLHGLGANIAIDKNNPAMVAVISKDASQGCLLEAFNISTPSQPIAEGYTQVTGLYDDDVTGLDFIGGTAYVAAGNQGLKIYRILSAPVIQATINDDFEGQNIAEAAEMAVIAGMQKGTNLPQLKVFNVNPNNPAAPSITATMTLTVFYDVVLNSTASMAVVAAGGQGIQVIDLSNPVAPSVIGSYNTPGSARGVALNSAGTLAYVADFYSLQIISLANPRAPSLVGSLSWSSGGWIDVAVSGGIACVADQLGNALFVVDVSIPNAPQRVGYKTLHGLGANIAIDKNNPAMVAVISKDASQGCLLEAFNISTPSQPIAEGYTQVTGLYDDDVTGLDFIGGTAYVAAGNQGLKIYDISSAPVFKNTMDVPGDAYDVTVNSSYAYGTGFPATVSIINPFAQ